MVQLAAPSLLSCCVYHLSASDVLRENEGGSCAQETNPKDRAKVSELSHLLSLQLVWFEAEDLLLDRV